MRTLRPRHPWRASAGLVLATVLLLAGCSSQTAGSAAPVTATVDSASDTSVAVTPATSSQNPSSTPQPTTSAPGPQDGPDPASSSIENDTGTSGSVGATPAPSTTPAASAALVTPGPETCVGLEQLELAYRHNDDNPHLWREWNWAINPAGGDLITLWAAMGGEWTFEIPSEPDRMDRLCRATAGLPGVEDTGAPYPTHRAFVRMATGDLKPDYVELTQEHAVGFETMLLDELPAGTAEEMTAALKPWHDEVLKMTGSSSGSTSSADTSSADTSSADTSSEDSGPADDEGAPECQQLDMVTFTYHPSPDRQDYHSTMFDEEQGSMTASFGDPADGVSLTKDFPINDAEAAQLLCEYLVSELAESSGEPGNGPRASVEIQTGYPGRELVSGVLVRPNGAYQAILLTVVPVDVQEELAAFIKEHNGG